MNDVVIRVEDLGKRYFIGHQHESERYSTLRDVIVRGCKRFWIKVSDTLKGTPIVAGDEIEEVWAIHDLNFEIRRGEKVGIIGRNGAGKSTLLKVLSRITEPTTGRATINGRIASLLEVGTGFHPELSGRENIYLNGAILGMTRREIKAKFDEIVDFAGVERFLDTPVKFYSSGMYVRLAFSVAAHLEPEILIVDEVLAVGDVEFQKKCLGKMDSVANDGRTILFVSHNMASIQGICTTGILLELGTISLMGEIASVVSEYLSPSKQQTGEVCWQTPGTAPGDSRVRLRAVRIQSEARVVREIDVGEEFNIEIDYWNLAPASRLFLAVEVYNMMGVMVFVSVNFPSSCLSIDPWFSRNYPKGLFRTTCSVPGYLLNDGTYAVTVKILENNLPSLSQSDHIVVASHVISFSVTDYTFLTRTEYSTGSWSGTIRPRLCWKTDQLSPTVP